MDSAHELPRGPSFIKLYYVSFMTKLLDRAIEAARRWPPADQDDIARLILRLPGTDDASPVPLTPDEQSAVAKSKAALHVASLPPTNRCALFGPRIGDEAALYSSRPCRP
jgi:hypothetical protein